MSSVENTPVKIKPGKDKTSEQLEREMLFGPIELFKLRACKPRESWTYNILYGCYKDKNLPTLEGFYNLFILSFFMFVATHPLVILLSFDYINLGKF